MDPSTPPIPEPLQRLIEARHHDPFSVLGRHEQDGRVLVRAFLPRVQAVQIQGTGVTLERIPGTDLFEWSGDPARVPPRYQLLWTDAQGKIHRRHDPYCFPPQLGDLDLHLFGEGRHWHAYRFLGAHERRVDGVDGILFSVWAPSAERVSLVGDFNDWDGRVHPMRVRGDSGLWELFLPEVPIGSLYKFEIRDHSGGTSLKIDPYARAFQYRPQTACIVQGRPSDDWTDGDWMVRRAHRAWQRAPLSIYEVHLGSWQKHADGRFLDYRELAERLVPYLQEVGFTHVELLPITEHPLDASWGYQPIGQEIFSLGRELMDVLNDRPSGRPFRLVVGVADVMPKLVVQLLLEPALALQEGVHLVCLEDKTDRLLAALALHELDVVLSDSPITPGLGVKAFSHLLGESGVTFLARKPLAGKLARRFPASLDQAPMLLPTENTALRRSLDAWFDAQGITPRVGAEFEDSALLKVFGERGLGVFPVPSVVEAEVCPCLSMTNPDTMHHASTPEKIFSCRITQLPDFFFAGMNLNNVIFAP